MKKKIGHVELMPHAHPRNKILEQYVLVNSNTFYPLGTILRWEGDPTKFFFEVYPDYIPENPEILRPVALDAA